MAGLRWRPASIAEAIQPIFASDFLFFFIFNSSIARVAEGLYAIWFFQTPDLIGRLVLNSPSAVIESAHENSEWIVGDFR